MQMTDQIGCKRMVKWSAIAQWKNRLFGKGFNRSRNRPLLAAKARVLDRSLHSRQRALRAQSWTIVMGRAVTGQQFA